MEGLSGPGTWAQSPRPWTSCALWETDKPICQEGLKADPGGPCFVPRAHDRARPILGSRKTRSV